VDSKFNHMFINFTPINERLCVIRIKGRFFNYSLINIHVSEEEAKDHFYEQLERAYAAWPSHDVKLVMRDANAKVGRETVHQTTIGKHSLHESTNEHELRLVDFAAGGQMAIKSTYFMHKRIHRQTWHSPDGHTFNQIDHCLIDGGHFSDVIDVMTWRVEGCKNRFRPHVSRYKIESKNLPCQQHKTATAETFRSRQTER
jgi:hypothetical protein